MTDRRFHRVVEMPSASLLVDNLADTLTMIKRRDGLHDRDMGDVLGKSADRVVAARTGEADISLTSFVRGVCQWGVSFGDRLLVPTNYRMLASAGSGLPDKSAPRVLTEALMQIVKALEDDNEVSDLELREAAVQIEALGTLADDLRHRLSNSRR